MAEKLRKVGIKYESNPNLTFVQDRPKKDGREWKIPKDVKAKLQTRLS